jgi:hypothetical protein
MIKSAAKLVPAFLLIFNIRKRLRHNKAATFLFPLYKSDLLRFLLPYSASYYAFFFPCLFKNTY